MKREQMCVFGFDIQLNCCRLYVSFRFSRVTFCQQLLQNNGDLRYFKLTQIQCSKDI